MCGKFIAAGRQIGGQSGSGASTRWDWDESKGRGRMTSFGRLGRRFVPTAVAGQVLLHLARRDWSAARDLVSHVQLEMADAELRNAEGVER